MFCVVENSIVLENPADNPEVRCIYTVSVDGFWLRIVPQTRSRCVENSQLWAFCAK